MRQLAVSDELVAQGALRAERQAVFRRLAVNQKTGTARSTRRGLRSNAVSFLADHEEQAKAAHASSKQFFRGPQHRSQNTLGVAGPPAPDKVRILARGKEWRHGIHVGGERDNGLAPGGEDVVAIGCRGNALEVAGMPSEERGQMREQEIAHRLLMVSGGFDIDESARQFERIHSRSFFRWSEGKEGTARIARAAASR